MCHRLARIQILALENTNNEPSIRMNVMVEDAVDAIRQNEDDNDAIKIANVLGGF